MAGVGLIDGQAADGSVTGKVSADTRGTNNISNLFNQISLHGNILYVDARERESSHNLRVCLHTSSPTYVFAHPQFAYLPVCQPTSSLTHYIRLPVHLPDSFLT